MYYEKIYLTVFAEFSALGGMNPVVIVWKDGQRYTVDRIKSVERAPCKSGGVLLIRYTVEINGQTKFLYFERNNQRFFVEKEVK